MHSPGGDLRGCQGKRCRSAGKPGFTEGAEHELGIIGVRDAN